MKSKNKPQLPKLENLVVALVTLSRVTLVVVTATAGKTMLYDTTKVSIYSVYTIIECRDVNAELISEVTF